MDQLDTKNPEKYCYNDLETNCNIYGGLYQWGEMVQFYNGASDTTIWSSVPKDNIQGLCPTGWYLPTDQNWCTLATYLDSTVNCSSLGLTGTNAGGKLKEKGTIHWSSPNTGATNSSLYFGLPGGDRTTSGRFSGLNTQAGFWTMSESSSTVGYGCGINDTTSKRKTSRLNKATGFSVRCFKSCPQPDAPTPGRNMRGSNFINWMWYSSPGAIGYRFSSSNDFTSAKDIGSNTSYLDTGLTCNTSYTRYIWAYNDCTHSNTTLLNGSTITSYQIAPIEGHHIATPTKIAWNWNPAFGATDYKWNTTDSLSTAVDVGSNLSKDEPGLTPNTVYIRYVWAINGDCGVSTPTLLTQKTKTNAFLCGQTINDPSDGGAGQNYNTIQVGNQCWMQQNMNVGIISNENGQKNDSIIEKFCYNNVSSNCGIYGGLYTWDEMMQYTTTPGTQGICPNGWYLPTDDDWCALTTYLDSTKNCGDSSSNAGGMIKEKGTNHWFSPNTGANNSSGFTALPGGGLVYPLQTYDSIEEMADFWTSTLGTGKNVLRRQLFYNQYFDGRSSIDKSSFQSVRCMKDCTPPSAPTQGVHIPKSNQIIWNWSVVTGAIGYRWNYTNDYNSAVELDTNSYTEKGLNSNTTYIRYVWAFKDGSHSLVTELTETTLQGFICPTTFTDPRDRKIYDVIQICAQCWMKENLNYGVQRDSTHRSHNDSVPEKYCYHDDSTNCNIYGGLYDWAEAVQYYHNVTDSTSWDSVPTKPVRGLCPPGWHIPSMDEYTTLMYSFTSPQSPDSAGYYLKEQGTNHWLDTNYANNESGWTGLGAGFAIFVWSYLPSYYALKDWSMHWTSTECPIFGIDSSAWSPHMAHNFNTLMLNWAGEKYGRFSIRCIMDSIPQSLCNQFIINAGPNDTYCPDSTGITIGGNPTAQGGSGYYTYAWTSNPPGFIPSVSNPLVNPSLTTVYHLCVTDYSNPPQTKCDSVTITVTPDSICRCNFPITFNKNLIEPALSTNAEGDVVLTGVYTGDSIAFGNSNYLSYSIKDGNPSNYQRIFVGKFNKKGRKQWAHSISCAEYYTETQYGKIIVDDSSNTFLVLYSKKQFLLENGQAYGNRDLSAYISVIKFGPSGNIAWVDTLGYYPKYPSITSSNDAIYLNGIASGAGNDTLTFGHFIAKIKKRSGHIEWKVQDPSWQWSNLCITYANNDLYLFHYPKISEIDTSGNFIKNYPVPTPQNLSWSYYFNYGGSDMFYLFSTPDLCQEYPGNSYALSGLQLTTGFSTKKCELGSSTWPSFAPMQNYAYLFYEGLTTNAFEKYDMQDHSTLPIWSDALTTNDLVSLAVDSNQSFGYYFKFYVSGSTSLLTQFDQSSGALGCSNKSVKDSVNLSKPLSSNWTIYPNPANDYLKILYSGNDNLEQVQFEIYNSIGINVYSKNTNYLKESETILNITSLPSGIYILRIVSNGLQKKSVKFVKY